MTTKDKNEFVVTMPVTKETITDFGINRKDVVSRTIGNRKRRVILVQTTEEVYNDYTRALWRDDKRRLRDLKRNIQVDDWGDGSYENRHDPCGKVQIAPKADVDIEALLEKKELIAALYDCLARLEELDALIIKMYANGCSETKIGKAVGLSQKAINKRKNKILIKLREWLKDFK